MKKLIIVLILIFIIVTGLYFWWTSNSNAVNLDDKAQKIFVIKSHENIRDIASNLKQQGFIKSPIVFFLLLKQMRLDGKIQAGDFRLSSSMNVSQIAQALTHGTLDIWITIPEGKRATEIAEIFQHKFPFFNETWKEKLIAQEGYLFPDTYLFPETTDIDRIITIMKNNFEAKYQQAAAGQTTKLSKEQVVILASLLEREGKSANDMKTISSVLQNRLAMNMPLQVDATIQYMLGYQTIEHSWWKKNVSLDDLKIPSAYNTYLNPGLPPTPISNPGFTALSAALHPADTSYIYYISDKNGNLHFSKTLDEQNANIQKYSQ